MIGTLARKRMQLRLPTLLAAALVAALVGAMFAASSPARAALGDVTALSGYCVQEAADAAGRVRVGPQTIATFVRVRDADDVLEDISCPASMAGQAVSVTPNGTVTPDLAVIDPSVVITLDGSADNLIVASGQQLNVRVAAKNFLQITSTGPVVSRVLNPTGPVFANLETVVDEIDPSIVAIDYVTGTGGLRLEQDFSTTWRTADNSAQYFLRVPVGTAPGQYTISANIRYDARPGVAGEGVTHVLGSTTFTITDTPAANLASASLTLANLADDNPLTVADETTPGSDTAPADSAIWLQVNARNALGSPSDSSGLTSVTVIGLGGQYTFHDVTADGARGGALGTAAVPNSVALSDANAKSSLFLKAEKAGSTPGTVDVRVIISGPGGYAESDTVTLTFTGPPAKVSLGSDVSLGQPAGNASAQREIALSATDAAGNPVALSAVAYHITDADGKAVSRSAIWAETDTAGSSTPNDDDDDNANAKVALLTVTSAAAPGAYTVTASLPSVADSSDTAMLLIAGAPANLTVATDKPSGTTLAELIKVTATVTDAAGVPVADGTVVTFALSGSGLYPTGTDASDAPGVQASTRGGDATAQYAVVGEGTAVISVLVGNQTSVLVFSSTASANQTPAVEEEPEEIGLHCLSRVTGFSTWKCRTGTTASELFAIVSDRGASAIHLHNGTDWIRYAVVDGREVPGSTDFEIHDNDILYISN